MPTRLYEGINLNRVTDRDVRSALKILDDFCRSVGPAVDAAAASAGSGGGGAPTSSPFVTIGNVAGLSAERALAVDAPITMSDGGANASVTLGFTFATPVNTYATTEAAGVANSGIRSDATFQFPQALMATSGGTDTLTLTQSGTDLTLTSSAGGAWNLRSTGEGISLPKWTGGGESAFTIGSILAFNATTTGIGTDLTVGVKADLTWNTGSYTSLVHRAGQFAASHASGGTFTTATLRVLEATSSSSTFGSGSHSWTERTGLRIAPGWALQSAGTVSVTDYYGILLDWAIATGNPGTVTNARGARLDLPPVGSTIRRGIHVVTETGNIGTEAADVEGVYVDDIARGTGTRSSFAFEGTTTGTPTTAYGLRQMTAHAVGTTRLGMSLLNAAVIENPNGLTQNVLTLNQLATDAGDDGAHILFNDKTTDPTTPGSGALWRNARNLRFYEGTLTHNLTPMTTRGDITRMSATTEERVALGADTSFLRSDGTDPIWSNINSLTADGTPDTAADYMMTWDASAGTHKKVLLSAVTGAGGGDNVTINTVAANTTADFDDDTPAAGAIGGTGASYLNVKWQQDGGTPTNVSAYIGRDTADNPILGFEQQASAVNFLGIWNRATGGGTMENGAPYLKVYGTDADAGLGLVPKGTGDVMMGTSLVGCPLSFREQAAPAAPTSPRMRMYAVLSDGESHIYAKNSTPTEFCLTRPLDSTFRIVDEGDVTKSAMFDCSGITTLNIRTFTFPDNDGTLLTKQDVNGNMMIDYVPTALAVDYFTFENGVAGSPGEVFLRSAGGSPSSIINIFPKGINGEVKASGVTIARLSGQLGGTYGNPDVRGLRETGTPTLLTMGAVADGDTLRRVGTTVVGRASPAIMGGFYDPGTVSLITGQFMLQYNRLTLTSTERFSAAGATNIVITDFEMHSEPIMGRPKARGSFVVPDNYEHSVFDRASLCDNNRVTLRGNADFYLTDNFRSRARVVLAGRG